MNEQLIRLFKAVEVKTKSKENLNEILKLTIPKGFIFSPVVIANYNKEELIKLIAIIKKEIGLTSAQMNSSFHKSWQKVKEASIEQLVLEQMIHYLTTYGFEQLGIYDKDSVYIPNEKLELPELTEDFKLLVINGYNKTEIKTKLMTLLNGIALSESTVQDVSKVAIEVGLTANEIELIKNKEVSTILFNHMNLIPHSPVEFLRLLVYKSTGKMLLIKSPEVISDLRTTICMPIPYLISKYKEQYGLEPLASIFYRYKPLFLALRTNGTAVRKYINKIRKLAKKHHKPMKPDYLNDLTRSLKFGVSTELNEELKKVNIYRKIRLAYALKFRTIDTDSIIYRIRNGKSYATSFDYKYKENARIALDQVLKSISDDIAKNVKGKKIYIPKEITYMLPTSDKQFTGNFPSGSYVSIPKNMIAGIYWEDIGSKRIDLDLSIIDTEQKIGWDGEYRNKERTILFSGDMTSAPYGASELFYIKKNNPSAYIVLVNYFNYTKDIEIPFKIIIAKNKMESITRNYMIDPNDVITIAKSKITQEQKILGLLITTTNECRFYFMETHIGTEISAGNLEYIEQSRRYLFDFYTNAISLNEMLVKAGAIIETDKAKCDIDLSTENLEKDTLINLISS